MAKYRIGVDLGGTKIEAIALDAEGKILKRTRIETPQGEYAATVGAICQLIQEIECSLGSSLSVGVATPGVISNLTGRMKNSNSTCLNGKNLKQDLEQELSREIRMANDANCFALSEAIDGAASDVNSVFAVIIGTGTGAGLVINKELVVGANAIAGEWGHNPLPWPSLTEISGQTCYCGLTGCIETWLSGPAIEREFVKASGQILTAKEIAELDEKDDSIAGVILSEYIDRMARSLATVINLFDPDAIILGGGIGNIDRLYQEVPTIWDQYVFSDHVETQLLKPVFGDSSGVRGAAWLWSDTLTY